MAKSTESFPRRASPPLQIPLNHVPTPTPGQPASGISSPLLAALGAYSNVNAQQTPVNHAADWANQLAQSPPDNLSNANSIAGSSPDSFRQTEELQGGFNKTSPQISPPIRYRKPVRPSNGYQSFGEYLGSSPGRGRPVSMHAQKSTYPPPPHQTQAHFYGAPEIDFGIPRARSESRPPMNNYCCVFDSLALAGRHGLGRNADVLLIGTERALNVYSVGKNQPTCIGRLEGLRGSVLQAKILPCRSRADPFRDSRPLVAVVIHGPYQTPPTEDYYSRPGSSHSRRSSFSASGSMMHALQAMDNDESDTGDYYQTTVEVFSLKERKHVATLLRGPKEKLEPSQIHPYNHTIPLPANFQLQASTEFITVAAGTSGEVFVFHNQIFASKDTDVAFKCAGKLWTRTLQARSRSLSMSSDPSESGRPYDSPRAKPHRPDVALVSLNHRWLAIVPPISSTQQTIHASVEKIRSSPKLPGFLSHTAPTEPPINCETDVPEMESLLNKVARVGTQELMKGARWVSGQGMQAWNNYWSKPSMQSPPNLQTQFPSSAQQYFPPTHAHDSVSTVKSNQSTVVSILDLEKLCDRRLKPDKATQPIATFALPYGCSWVSFAPNGLNLLTVSLKGDIQQIWSLMRMIHGEAERGTGPSPKGRVPFAREVKRFTRLTVANIIDVVWAEPRGESLAILTERGTVHINDIPATALQWPPPRRLLRPATAPGKVTTEEKDMDVAVPAASAGGSLGAAFNMVSGSAKPLLAAVRGRPASVGSNALSSWTSLGFPAGAGAKSSKVVAAGLNKSIGAATGTVNTLKHLGENRLTIPGMPNVVMPGCVKWLGGKNRGLIAVTGGMVVKIHSVSQSTNAKPSKRRPSVTASKAIDFTIPESRTTFGVGVSNYTQEDLHPATSGVFWKSSAARRRSRRRRSNLHPVSYYELNTNAPYQPFHTDSRVSCYVYDDDTTTDRGGNTQWAFGEDIPCTKISAGLANAEDQIPNQPNRLENLVENQGHQLVVTTRRMRPNDTSGNEAEFFDDDCEVIDYADDRV